VKPIKSTHAFFSPERIFEEEKDLKIIAQFLEEVERK
jgi:hypothetical protein